MKLILYFPDISPLLEPGAPACPTLERLLAAGRHSVGIEPLRVLLCKSVGVQPQGDWPLAALGWLGEGHDPAQDYWLQADPVHLVLQRDYFTLHSPVPLPLRPDEADALIADLNRHFAADGLQFLLGQPRLPHAGSCYLRLQESADVHGSLPEYAIGKDIRGFLPHGADEARWRSLANEIQMLLHEHPVNQAREARGELPANSLWFSAGGVQPAEAGADVELVFADYPLLAGLARVAGIACQALPRDAHAVLRQAKKEAWLALDRLEQAEQLWFAPLLQALSRRTLRRIELHFAVGARVLSVRASWYDLLRCWRRPRPLSTYFSAPYFSAL